MEKFMTPAQLKKLKARIDLLKVEEQKQRELDEQYHKKMYDARDAWQECQRERQVLERVVEYYDKTEPMLEYLKGRSCTASVGCVLVGGHGGAHRFR